MHWRGALLVALLGSATALAQTPAGLKWSPQAVTIDGQVTTGANVFAANGSVQSFTCPAPRPYAASDGERGWACYDPSTRVWLLRSQAPPVAAPATAMPSDTASAASDDAAPPADTLAGQTNPAAQEPAPPQVVYVEAPPRVVYVEAPPAVVYVEVPTTVIYVESPRDDRPRDPRQEPAAPAAGYTAAPVFTNTPVFTAGAVYTNPPAVPFDPARDRDR